MGGDRVAVKGSTTASARDLDIRTVMNDPRCLVGQNKDN